MKGNWSRLSNDVTAAAKHFASSITSFQHKHHQLVVRATKRQNKQHWTRARPLLGGHSVAHQPPPPLHGKLKVGVRVRGCCGRGLFLSDCWVTAGQTVQLGGLVSGLIVLMRRRRRRLILRVRGGSSHAQKKPFNCRTALLLLLFLQKLLQLCSLTPRLQTDSSRGRSDVLFVSAVCLCGNAEAEMSVLRGADGRYKLLNAFTPRFIYCRDHVSVENSQTSLLEGVGGGAPETTWGGGSTALPRRPEPTLVPV